MSSEGVIEQGFRRQPLWLLLVLLLVAGQCGLTLQIFDNWTNLRDHRPIVSGRHPLHLYHAGLGSETFLQRYTTACFDPNFQAGYPKTPVFDGGCRPAEFALVLFGGGYRPDAYKLGLFALCLIVPIAFALAGRGAGLPAPACVVAASLGIGLWWSPTVRAMLEAGDTDLLLAGLASLIFMTWLSRYNWDPGPFAWIILALTAVIGWYAHPVVWLGVAPIFGVYYLVVAPRHGLAWHLGLIGITLVGLGPNFWWLWDWGRFWWIRQPSVDDIAPLPTWGALLGSWKSFTEMLGPAPFGWPIVVLGVLGLVPMIRQKQHSAPGTLVITACFALLITRLGQIWTPLINGGAERAGPLVVAFAVLPTAVLITGWNQNSQARERAPALLLLLAVALPLLLGWGGEHAEMLRQRMTIQTHPLPLGLTPDQESLVVRLKARTTPEARILIEESSTQMTSWNWTALLPEFTQRSFLGGLDPEACFEHAFCSMNGDRLNGRLLNEWKDSELYEFCRRYNVGWVLCRSSYAEARWRRLPGAHEVERFRDGGELVLFEIQRPRSYLLLGSANWEHADRKKVVLTNVMPVDFPSADGRAVASKAVVLSLHYQSGLQISPNSVLLDRDPDPYDPIPMIRLRMSGPVSRIVLSWENP